MNLLRIDLSEFVRIVYAGLLVGAFICWRYPEVNQWLEDYAVENPFPLLVGILIFSLVVGILIYAIYRGFFYYPLVRCIEDKTHGIPQFEFYRSVANQLNAPKKCKKMKWAAACANKVLVIKAPTDFRAGLYRFNSFVHVPFLTSFVVFLAFLHDLIRGFECWWVWLIISFGFFIVGFFFDRCQSDPSEAAFLVQHRKEYEEFIRDLSEALSKADTELKNAKR